MAEDLLDMTLKLHFEAQVKFCYYLLGLTTALLGFSIQFTSPSGTDLVPSLVFLSWLTLVISLIAGIRWQQQWINFTGEMHSGLVNRRNHNNTEADTKEMKNETSSKLLFAEIIQVSSFIIGLILFAVYKVVNYYVI